MAAQEGFRGVLLLQQSRAVMIASSGFDRPRGRSEARVGGQARERERERDGDSSAETVSRGDGRG